ncbi:hypothetical protein P154DRAFT_332272 [Amniculicola lignicola CBS 123094]|uniref:Uncharacterized protein n=1 Tax=Amniculicola lignicola CBS 123094 TaxID=1392246 RepID=A0A6A5W6Q0_9PLEO|nr:hypothetical protein P154DRAFT_332272 [Amniculicola lignicola CBS 123094]
MRICGARDGLRWQCLREPQHTAHTACEVDGYIYRGLRGVVLILDILCAERNHYCIYHHHLASSLVEPDTTLNQPDYTPTYPPLPYHTSPPPKYNYKLPKNYQQLPTPTSNPPNNGPPQPLPPLNLPPPKTLAQLQLLRQLVRPLPHRHNQHHRPRRRAQNPHLIPPLPPPPEAQAETDCWGQDEHYIYRGSSACVWKPGWTWEWGIEQGRGKDHEADTPE